MNHTRAGSGEPLVLIHGIGSRLGIWDPVLPLLTPHFDVVAVDLPGFGGSPALPADVVPTPRRLAEEVVGLLDDLEIDRAHLCGNSLGGQVSLEMAMLGRALSVTGLSPGGLFERAPRTTVAQLNLSRALALRLAPRADRVFRSAFARHALLGAMYGKPGRLPAANAAADLRGLAEATDFDRVRDALGDGPRLDARTVTVPVTVAFGSKDVLLDRWQAQKRDLLPPQHRWVVLRGCGHIPTWDDPVACAQLVLETVDAAHAAAA